MIWPPRGGTAFTGLLCLDGSYHFADGLARNLLQLKFAGRQLGSVVLDSSRSLSFGSLPTAPRQRGLRRARGQRREESQQHADLVVPLLEGAERLFFMIHLVLCRFP
jgi:hypothetical protein